LMKHSVPSVALLAVVALAAGCSSRTAPVLTLATTTSTRDTGLLDILVPRFEGETGIGVKVIAVGTGQALELGRRGDADVLLVHDPASEERFLEEGHGTLRRPVMHNDFLLEGPPDGPAEVKGRGDVTAAFAQIARVGAPCVSRGDESGTHQKEKPSGDEQVFSPKEAGTRAPGPAWWMC